MASLEKHELMEATMMEIDEISDWSLKRASSKAMIYAVLAHTTRDGKFGTYNK